MRSEWVDETNYRPYPDADGRVKCVYCRHLKSVTHHFGCECGARGITVMGIALLTQCSMYRWNGKGGFVSPPAEEEASVQATVD